MVVADWTTGAVDGRVLNTHLRQITERELGTLLDSTGGFKHDRNRACVSVVYVGHANSLVHTHVSDWDAQPSPNSPQHKHCRRLRFEP